jgi:hypothetical protein
MDAYREKVDPQRKYNRDGGHVMPAKATSKGNTRTRSGNNQSSTLSRAKAIEKPGERPDRNGQTLTTHNHDVIKRWADERGGAPATTTKSGPPRVLRLDFPGYGGQSLRKISWDDWFKTFDDRGVTFVFQEKLRNGNQSNFFRLTNPRREDG